MKRVVVLVLSLVLALALATSYAQDQKIDEELLNSARQAAVWIAENPQADTEAVQALCDSLGVDAIHFVDANGLVALSNEAEAVGYDLASDEQSKPFLALLSGEADELAQAPAARGFDGGIWRFAAVSGGLEGGLTQVAIKVDGE